MDISAILATPVPDWSAILGPRLEGSLPPGKLRVTRVTSRAGRVNFAMEFRPSGIPPAFERAGFPWEEAPDGDWSEGF